MKATIIYTTDGKLNPVIQDFCFERLKDSAGNHKIVKVENPEGVGRSYKALYENILAGIETAKTKLVFIAEHDCLYPDGYFDLAKCPKISYSKDVLYLDENGFYKRELPNGPLSTFAGDKAILKKGILATLASKKKIKHAEIGIDDKFSEQVSYRNVSECIIDIRHGDNFTGARSSETHFERYPYWQSANVLWNRINNLIEKKPSSIDEFAKLTEEKVLEKADAAVKAAEIAGNKQGDIDKEIEDFKNGLPSLEPPVSIVITSRCEELLGWTIDNVNRTAPGCEIVVVYDGWQQTKYYGPSVRTFFPWPIPIGVGPCRDYGIEKATREYVVLLDAHMDFEEGWLEKLMGPVQENPEAISCSRSAVLRPDQLDMKKVDKINSGARMQFLNEKRMPFEPKWAKSKAGEVQIILGACYCMLKNHYMENLFRPWHNAFGWGSSEQLISVVNWFLGGKNILTDALSGHVYRDRNAQMPYAQTPGTTTGIFYNRVRVIDLLPISDEEKKGLIDCVLNRKDAKPYHNQVRNLFINRDDDLLKEAIEIRALTWEDYAKRWYPAGVQFPASVEKQKINKTSTQQKSPRGRVVIPKPHDPFSVNPEGDSRFI